MEKLNSSLALDSKIEKGRKEFVYFLRTLASHYLRRIATSYYNVDKLIRSDRDPLQLLLDPICNELLHRDLKNSQLENCTIGGRKITYKQARVIYELIFEGKYGGFRGDNKPFGPLALPGKIPLKSLEENSELFGTQFYNRPEGWFPAIDHAVG